MQHYVFGKGKKYQLFPLKGTPPKDTSRSETNKMCKYFLFSQTMYSWSINICKFMQDVLFSSQVWGPSGAAMLQFSLHQSSAEQVWPMTSCTSCQTCSWHHRLVKMAVPAAKFLPLSISTFLPNINWLTNCCECIFYFLPIERTHDASSAEWWLFPRLQGFGRMFVHPFPTCALFILFYFFLCGD